MSPAAAGRSSSEVPPDCNSQNASAGVLGSWTDESGIVFDRWRYGLLRGANPVVARFHSVKLRSVGLYYRALLLSVFWEKTMAGHAYENVIFLHRSGSGKTIQEE